MASDRLLEALEVLDAKAEAFQAAGAAREETRSALATAAAKDNEAAAGQKDAGTEMSKARQEFFRIALEDYPDSEMSARGGATAVRVPGLGKPR